jgi:UDP-glucose 4,6-dehydratase
MLSQNPDASVVCLDRLDACSSSRNIEHLESCKRFKFVQGDICSQDLVRQVIQDNCIDTILHFAAQTHVGKQQKQRTKHTHAQILNIDNSFGNSIRFTKDNVVGTHTLLEAAKEQGDQIRRFVHVSTDEVYGESSKDAGDDARKREGDALNPTNPYAATKVAAEFLVKSYHTSFGLPTVITRGVDAKKKKGKGTLCARTILSLSRKQCLRAQAISGEAYPQVYPSLGKGETMLPARRREQPAKLFVRQ